MLDIEISIPIITVFLQGLLSFFSPCVLPLVPMYIGYLAGGTKSMDEQGNIIYKRKTIMLNTLLFVVGISAAFFLLGLGFSAAGQFFSSNRMLLARIGGGIIILFGLFQLGFFGSKFLNQDRRLPLGLSKLSMNPFTALLLGFIFSFAWTPCVGPALTSVLIMASSASSGLQGFLLIGVYTIGFIIPFLAVGLFTGTLLNFFKKHQKAVKYTVKVGGALMILMGVMMITGWMNNITGYLSSISGSTGGNDTSQTSGSQSSNSQDSQTASEDTDSQSSADNSESSSQAQGPIIPADDFTLVDQNGETHSLSDYKGKVVFLNFWATWCGPCIQEMPDIQSLYEDHGLNSEDVVVLGVAAPGTVDGSQEEVEQFISDGGFTYPTVMDTTGEVFIKYGIAAYPTTYMIDEEGNIFGFVRGSISREIMDDIVRQTKES